MNARSTSGRDMPRSSRQQKVTLRVLSQLAEVDDQGRLTAIREVVSVQPAERQFGFSADHTKMFGLL